MADRIPFPQDQSEFANDPRVAFSKEKNNYFLEDEKGTEWEWIASRNTWSETVPEELMKQWAEAYKVEGVDENEPAMNPAQKRKQAQLDNPEENPNANKAKRTTNATTAKTTATDKLLDPDNAIVVTGLPLDVNADEIEKVFQRYGVIAETPNDSSKIIHISENEDGLPTGNAVIVFNDLHGVAQSIELQDDAEFSRKGSRKTNKISVRAATKEDFQREKVRIDKPVSDAQLKRKKAEIADRLKSFEDEDEEPIPAPRKSASWEKLVIISNIFTLAQLEEDEELADDIHRDVLEDAETIGPVKNVVVYDLEPRGICVIRFRDVESAQKCADAWDGRRYNGRAVRAGVPTEAVKFKRSLKTRKEDDEEERLAQFSKDLEAGA
ncbi:unnamed protein product [Zymoseptoria tritici ST99CH_1A5]|uniref:RRM domain-containing protein n=3 Tax=Zymoseptoria tritici TaxID=1047171 RepID=A0A1X7RGY6_ZYMT9|nr:unnamed protein product [Zymoseptoria tritici ST99CH_3D7]SMR43029.1 unnamed protein product [Zymoseptoria tritici ST99CH_1E4]SMR45197.1 unnamed protein product [Zymoseptoria tritici ST99CH_3D1]SMY20362.1 unnamed protein product [Zymoseptoria tritici ST99CH_1A5]